MIPGARKEHDSFGDIEVAADALWGAQSFYRVFSLVNGGRQREADLFEGLRG